MKNNTLKTILFILITFCAKTQAQIADPAAYLSDIKKELNTVWPKNRTINLVFHGHSVPSGYGDNHLVHTLEAYPNLLLKTLKEKYPYAVINVIVTAIGGEDAIRGQARFEKDVLPHKPDVLFIDYALNDRFSPLDKVRDAWEKMIKSALANHIKVILLTPSPDQRIDISDPTNPLDPYAEQIKSLAVTYKTGLADPYTPFKKIVKEGNVKNYMTSINHPNKEGHMIIVGAIKLYFY
ncbi:SGNH/GDSL hydrolase family protein [Dyadobacter subterraneus]|uniref:SGNH/GDSL hydrolase family protein n=1 Tax=Dyadobacter subterraneus TaxID=2773304 RepID=A0ABR9W888_9BACT|nr:GDSL-type esterase/lipase family protein [Dyadobacter subterraneus]MBE9461657.1 SGNH/GDSL hydrolase family protein [Dyadobacter subterraneus]